MIYKIILIIIKLLNTCFMNILLLSLTYITYNIYIYNIYLLKSQIYTLNIFMYCIQYKYCYRYSGYKWTSQ